MNKYFIGDIHFKTKKACLDYTRTKIKNLGCCTIDKEHVDFNFFNHLLKNHYEHVQKISLGVHYFYIIPNPINSMYYQTMIKRLDNSLIDFSWVYCCKFKARSTTEDLTTAMRETIKEETIAYKKNQIILQCDICKSDSELYKYYHVDHAFPSFRTLKNDFLNLTKHYLLNDFISIVERKGYDWEVLKDEKKERADKYDYITRKQGITDAKILVDENDNVIFKNIINVKSCIPNIIY